MSDPLSGRSCAISPFVSDPLSGRSCAISPSVSDPLSGRSVPLYQTHFQVGLVGQIPIGPSVSDPHSSSSGRSCVTVIIYHSQHSHVRPTLKCLSDPTTHVSDPTGSSLTGPVGQSVPLYQTHPEVFLQDLSDN